MKKIKSEANFDMFDWWKKVFIDNYANFDGRARRAEFWYFNLVNLIGAFLFGILIVASSFGLASESESPILFIVLMILFFLGYLVMLIPSIAVAVRRLHDTGKSGWWYLIKLIPFLGGIGSIVLLVFYCLEGDKGQNEFGPDPKAPLHDEIAQIGIR